MILPTKHISEAHSILGVGGTILEILGNDDATASSLWEELRMNRLEYAPVSFDWYVLALDFLYMIDAVEINSGLIKRKAIT
jgi:hypothetical protein